MYVYDVQGLLEVLDRNSQLGEPILSMLRGQLLRHYEINTDISPPLRLEPAILAQGDQVFLTEPLVRENKVPLKNLSS